MKLFEYQAKELFAHAGIPVPRAELVEAADDATAERFSAAVAEAAGRLLSGDAGGDAGASRVVVKSQLLMGGRGKAGLIKPAGSVEEAAGHAAAFFSGEHQVRAVLIEEAVNIARELYLAISADPANARFVVLASAEGGVEIEELALARPEAVLRLGVDVHRGLQPYQARGLAYDLGLSGDQVKEFSRILTKLYQVFSGHDAELAEINPLFITAGGMLVAGDGKVSIDDNSLFRQSRFERTRAYFDSDAAFEADREGIPYLQFDGDISLMCAGAGLTTTVFDLVHYEGGTVANYLEFGGPNYRKAKRAMELCLKNDSAVILVVTFGTIARADVMAHGVVEAIAELKPDRPIVTCIRGTNEEEAVKTLSAAGLEPLFDTEEAVRRAIALAAERRSGGTS